MLTATEVRTSPRLAFLVEHLDLQEATGDPNAVWETFQVRFFNNESTLTLDHKARQVGWSWTAAADAVVSAILTPRLANIFVSINLEEAAEKIRYAKQIIECLDAEVRPKLLTDNRLELELVNGSRLISHPCTAVRGKAKAKVFLDEFAHYPRDREIYASALPVITRGGSLHIGSSPLGAGGVFWEISEQKTRLYPGYLRRTIPWWQVSGLCKNVEEARKIVFHLPTEERVRLFGTRRILEIFENMLLEDFQQEYECAFQDESEAWIPWEDIKKSQSDAESGKLWYRQANGVEDAFAAIDETLDAVRGGDIEGVLAGGMDVGRHKNLTELIFVGKGTLDRVPYRLGISLSNAKFEDQFAVAERALSYLPVSQFLIDQNGLGMQLAEQLNLIFGVRAQGVDFTNPTKELWAVELKIRIQKGEVPIPLDRQLSYQLHSIKKVVTAAKNAVFDAPRNEKAHADKFWALALAVWAAKQATAKARSSGVVVL